jgi:hypothetical protein
LKEIGKRNWEYAHRLFQCVAAASRPLRVEELAEFLAFDFDSESTPILHEDWREEDPAYAVRSTCSSLLVIVNVDGSPVIQFSHFSVKEYLTSKRLLEADDTLSRFHISMTQAHTMVVQACLGVLLHLHEGITKDDLKHFLLAKYAARYWVGHAKFDGVWPNVQDETKRLFDPNYRHLPVWVWIDDPESGKQDRNPQCPSQARASALHYAAYCGLTEVVKFLIVERSQNVNTQCFSKKETPLVVASRQGHSEVARVLIAHGADPETRDIVDWSPLERASRGGYVEVVQTLLQHGADVNALDENQMTSLHTASATGQLTVARVLLDHGADPNAKVCSNRTSLHFGSNEGGSHSTELIRTSRITEV